MSDSRFHFVTVGWERALIDRLWAGVAADADTRVSHVVHPRWTRDYWPDAGDDVKVHFFRRRLHEPLPKPDPELLASLEQDGVPTVHNMILGDRVLARLPYGDSLAYATFLARRLNELFGELSPSAIISGFDSIHAGLALAVARRMGIPWFALHFCVIPPGFACFCDRLSPAARVRLSAARDPGELRLLARESLQRFEDRSIKVHAYVAPDPPSLVGQFGRLPPRMSALMRTMRRARQREILKYTDGPARYSPGAAIARIRQISAARSVSESVHALERPPAGPFVLFALHTQPESSIDVWAPFFSNQMWVIELLARSIPPSCRLLVKIHKSDVANYSADQLVRIRSFPGVELVRPFADTRSFVESAALVVAIQGTIGLEAALLGKPVIMLGESPVTAFPSATGIGRITDLPGLVRKKLAEVPPAREAIVEAYASYLAPFLPASHNDWTAPGDAGEARRFAELFAALRQHVTGRQAAAANTEHA